MNSYSKPVQIRWADVDMNRHLRHSVYYDFGAMLRIRFFAEMGLTTSKLEELHIGPIIFREECIFKKEIKLEDEISMNFLVTKSNRDFSRWSIRHHITKADETLCAIINLDGAWIDLQKRKLARPDEFVQRVFSDFPKSDDFELL